MNYSTIVYNAFTTEGKFVSDYFISECKKAERDEFITPEMFIAGCLSVCNGLKTEIKKTFYNWATECKQYDEQGNELPFNIDEISYPFGDLQVDNNHIDFIIEMIEIAKIELIDLPDAVKIGEKIDELIAEKFDSKKAPPAPPAKFTAKKIIDIYDSVKVYKEFKRELKCDYDTFRMWFVDGLICDKKMSWKYSNGNKTQLRSFIYNLCEGWTPKETNTAFNVVVDSNDRDTQINNDLLQRLEKCKKD